MQTFAGTDRQVRGRLMEVLRGSPEPVERAALDAAWADAGQRDRCLDSLLVDGLAEQLDEGRELRLKLGGGSAGHNGLRSLTSALRTPDYHRVRIGVGRPPGRQDPADFVLQPIARRDEADIAIWTDRAADAVTSLVTEGLAAAQDRFNKTQPPA